MEQGSAAMAGSTAQKGGKCRECMLYSDVYILPPHTHRPSLTRKLLPSKLLHSLRINDAQNK